MGGIYLPFVTIDQAFNMYYNVNGISERTPIVFIHPPAMGSITFKKQLVLAEKYRVITYDSRGNGLSGFSNEKISIPLLAEDLRKLLDHLEINEAVICSYSNGAAIGLEFALTYPDRTKAVLLSGGFPEVNSFLLAGQFQLGMLTARCNGIKLLAKILAISHTKEKIFQQELYESVLKVNPHILFEMYKAGYKYNCTSRLSQIKKPLLLVYGGKVDYLHKHYRLFEKHIEQTDTIFIDQSKHQIPTKHFREFNKILDHFLQNITASSS